MTDSLPPSPADLVSGLLDLLNVEQTAADSFRGKRKPGGVGRVFGGQVIAQALVSAERTVDPTREVHSLHAYFLRGGSEDHEIDFAIARDFDGGSFSNRRIVASQNGTPILNLVASFHKREDGVHHQDAMPDVPDPDGLVNEAQILGEYLKEIPITTHPMVVQPKAIEVRPARRDHWMGTNKGPSHLATWFRTAAALPDDPHIHRAVLAWASDYTLLGTAGVPHGINWLTGKVKAASLDHAIWFHGTFRADEWLLYATDSPWAGRGRGFNRGRIFTRDGRLVAETAQEGLIRVID